MVTIVPAEVNQYLTQQSLAASAPTLPARVRPACPLCGGDTWEVYDRMGKFVECDNKDCYYCETSGPCTEVADADCDYERNYERKVA